jgi:D-glycero-alpha-D-manno-heptose 1-phosphate guanylyltransferase
MTSAVILAGGLGTRLRSAVPDLPKPMAPVNGRPFLSHLLEYWVQQGVGHFVLSVGYRCDVIMGYFGDKYKNASIEYVVESTPLGTGGGLLLAAEKLQRTEPFLLLNGDTFFTVDLKKLSNFASERDADWCFSLFRANEVGRYMGMDISSQGRVNSLQSGTGQPGRLANGGVYWIHPRALAQVPFSAGVNVSLEDGIFASAMTLGQRLMGVEFEGTFIDIGIPDDYHRAATLLSL